MSTRFPALGEWNAIEQVSRHGGQEVPYVLDYFLEFGLCNVGRVFSTERGPLLLFIRIVVELRCESDWGAASR